MESFPHFTERKDSLSEFNCSKTTQAIYQASLNFHQSKFQIYRTFVKRQAAICSLAFVCETPFE